jgi:hypothetical protein
MEEFSERRWKRLTRQRARATSVGARCVVRSVHSILRTLRAHPHSPLELLALHEMVSETEFTLTLRQYPRSGRWMASQCQQVEPTVSVQQVNQAP